MRPIAIQFTVGKCSDVGYFDQRATAAQIRRGASLAHSNTIPAPSYSFRSSPVPFLDKSRGNENCFRALFLLSTRETPPSLVGHDQSRRV
jgi:hypothetical protein